MLQSTSTSANPLGGIFLVLAIVLLAMSPTRWQTFTRMVGAFIITAVVWLILGIIMGHVLKGVSHQAIAFAVEAGFMFGPFICRPSGMETRALTEESAVNPFVLGKRAEMLAIAMNTKCPSCQKLIGDHTTEESDVCFEQDRLRRWKKPSTRDV